MNCATTSSYFINKGKIMGISLLVPVRNAQETIIELFDSIYKGSLIPNEVIVVDQSDNDLTRDEIKKYESATGRSIYYKKSFRKGLCANRNDCIEEANNEFLVFIDQDMTVDEKWLENIISEWEQNWEKGLVVISGRTLPGEEFAPDDLVPSIQNGTVRKVYTERPRTTEVLYGAYFAASKELFKSLNPQPFDERLGVGTNFPGADDTDFAYRVIAQNYPIVFEPKLLAYHHPPPRSWRKMRFDYSVGYGAYLCKYLLKGDILMLRDLVSYILTSLYKGLKSIIKFEEPEGSSRILGLVGTIKGFFLWVFK
jgi:glycosyltransferase involved in cell wall biosynthesis